MTVPAATVNQYYTGIFRQAPTAAVSNAYQAMSDANSALQSMLSAANLQVDPVVRLYQTAFNRVPDSAGMTAWVPVFMAGSQSLQQIANGFTQSTEFLNLYPASMSNAQYVGALYWNILQRAGEDSGMAAWVGALNNGTLTRAQVLLGFSNSTEFVAKIEPNVNSFLTACANATATYTGSLWDQGGSSTGETYNLTVGADYVPGTGGNDKISGLLTANNAQTWQSWDTINGGAGNDTLTAELNGTTVTMSNVTSVENINLNVSAAQTVDFNGAAFVQTVTAISTNTLALNNIGLIPTNVSLQSSNTTTIDFDTAALSGTSDNLNITLAGGHTGAITVTDDGSAPLETITITSNGSTNTANLTTSALGTTALYIKGAGNFTTTITDANATLKTIDGSAATGKLNLTGLASSTIVGGAGNDTIVSGGGNDNFSGGAGNDTFTMAATLTSADTIDGGTGTDTLSVNSATLEALTAATKLTKITNVETISLATAITAAATINTLYVSADVNRVNINAQNGGAATLNMGSGAQTVGINIADVTGGANTLTIDADGTGTADSLTITNMLTTGDMGAATAPIVVTDFETVTLATGTYGTTAAQNVNTLNIGTSGALVITGGNGLTTAGAITAKSIDASGITGTGALSMGAAAASGLVSIIGSANADTLRGDASSSIAGGAGNDTIVGGTGNDTLLGEIGNDSITAGTGNDLVDGGEGNDVVVFATTQLTSADTVIGGAGTDTLSYSSYANADDTAGAMARVSEFETLRLAGSAGVGQTVTMSNFLNNSGFTKIEFGDVAANAGDGFAISNVSGTLNDLRIVAASTAAPDITFARLVDTSNDTLTITQAVTGAGAAVTYNAVTANNEETLNISGTNAVNDLTITTLTANKLVTLNVTGDADVIITNAISGSTNLTTVSASSTTGAVTVNGSASLANMTMTAGSGIATFTSGAGSDVITGGASADVLSGGAGNDTIVGGGGADNITGGTGADSMTGGSAADTFVFAAATTTFAATLVNAAGANFANGDTVAFANGVDIITDFVSGTDSIDAGTAAALTALSGATATGNLTATKNYYAYGTYSGGVFTFNDTVTSTTANVATLLVHDSTAATFATNSARSVILLGVATIAAGDIV